MTTINIDKIAQLANLDLTEAEKATFQHQFADILQHFEALAQAPVAELPPAAADSRLRPDTQADSGFSPQAFSPYMENNHFKVPRVIE